MCVRVSVVLCMCVCVVLCLCVLLRKDTPSIHFLFIHIYFSSFILLLSPYFEFNCYRRILNLFLIFTFFFLTSHTLLIITSLLPIPEDSEIK